MLGDGTDADVDLVVSIISLATEREFFGGDNSFGVGGDLGSATALATRMLRRAGMGETLSAPANTTPLTVTCLVPTWRSANVPVAEV